MAARASHRPSGLGLAWLGGLLATAVGLLWILTPGYGLGGYRAGPASAVAAPWPASAADAHTGDSLSRPIDPTGITQFALPLTQARVVVRAIVSGADVARWAAWAQLPGLAAAAIFVIAPWTTRPPQSTQRYADRAPPVRS